MKKREYSDRFPHSAVKDIVLRLARERDLPDEELSFLIESGKAGVFLAEEADRIRRQVYGTDVYIRGLI